MEISDDGKRLTTFDSVCAILSELWLDYKTDRFFKDFIEYNDIGLPIAFLVDSELVEPTEMAKRYVYETWDIFLAALEISEDLGWESLKDIFIYVNGES